MPDTSDPADAYIITGNPNVAAEHAEQYAKFYDSVKKHVESLGLSAQFDPGLPNTIPPGGKYWIGHSRGVSRLRHAPEGVKTLALDDYEPEESRTRQTQAYDRLFKELGVTTIADVPLEKRPQPGPEHYTFNEHQRNALTQLLQKQADLAAKFTPDYTPEQLESLGVYDSLYRGQGPRLASLGEWKPEWISQHDPKGWAQWYKRYASGRRIPDEDERQMKRWLSFKARHGGPFAKNPTPRRGWALRNWGIDPANLVTKDQRNSTIEMLDEYKLKAMQKHIADQSSQLGKQAAGPAMPALKAPPVAASPHKSNLFTATNTQETLGQNIGRWYQNSGGLNNAMNRAQQAQQQNTAAGNINRTKFPEWDVNKVNTPVPIKTYGRATNFWNMPGAGGQFSPAQIRMGVSHSDPNYAANVKTMMETANNFYLHDKEPNLKAIDPGLNYEKIPANIELRGGLSDAQAVKEHELTHAATIPGVAALNKADVAAATNGRIAYPDQPTEIDVRLAEIKRRYAHHTGKLVDSPEEAQKAWEWWRQNQNQLQTQRPEDKPTMDPEFFKRYDKYPTDRRQELFHRMPELVQQQNNAFKFGMVLGKQADLNPDVQLQEHQQRIADRMTGGDNRLLVYHGLGSGKSLSALAAAEAAKKVYGDQYGVVAPAALKGNFDKEVKKFTTGSDPEIMSYTGLGMGKQFKTPPQTLVMDEAHRLRNPGGSAAQAASREARSAKNLLLLTGSPITNSPTDLANLISLLDNKKLTPEQFEQKFVGYKNVSPGVINWLRGIESGEQPVVKNESELRGLLKGKVDYQPSKTPEGVNVDEQVVNVPLSPAQQKIQKAIRTKIPPGFLWKLDREFPLSRDELSKLNSFLTGLRQVSISTRPFRADKDPIKSFEQSAKLQQAFKDLQETLTSDDRKKAIIYSNHIDAGLSPYAAALSKNNIPHALFHGSISPRERQRAVNDYNEGKLRALLIGPAGAEGLSTRGTSLIQLLDPHWHESRSQQAKGRGLRFDSHRDLPEELKNVAVKRYISASEDPSLLGKLMGYQRERTGDEILENLAKEKEMLNDKFREILKQEGAVKNSSALALPQDGFSFPFVNGTGAANWFRQNEADQAAAEKSKKKQKSRSLSLPRIVPTLATAGLGVGALGAGTAYAVASDKHIKDIASSIKNYHSPLNRDETILSRYADVLSASARTSPFGFKISDLLTGMRTSPTLLSLAGVPSHYAAKHPGDTAESKAHYDLFSTGPIAAYDHMLRDSRYTPDASAGGFTPAEIEKLTLRGLNPEGKTKLGLGEAMHPRFIAAYDKWIKEQMKPGGKMHGGRGWLRPSVMRTKFVPHDEQMKFIKQYVSDLPDELRDAENRMNEETLTANARNYVPMTSKAIDVRERLKNIGLTTGGASAGGLLAHVLHDRLAGRNPDGTKKKRKRFDPAYLASVLAGTGLGGLAGNYAARRSSQ